MRKIPYSIESYNSDWAKKYNKIEKNPKNIFSTKALQIEHIGSTSIPDMKAKPIIDVLLIVEDIKNLSEEIKSVKTLGYNIRENVIDENSLLLEKGIGEDKTENIHILEKGSHKISRLLDTRDFLRTHPDRAKLYKNLKEEIYTRFPDDYYAYRTAKEDFMEETFKLARMWKQGSNN